MRRAAVALMVVAAALVAWAGTAGSPAGASCIPTVTYLGAPFHGAVEVGPAQVGGPVGPGTIPACNDTVPALGAAAPTPVTVHRVRGVAPRLGVALPTAAGPTMLMVLAEGPCPMAPAARALACLRRETRRMVEGPSLIAPPSARAGDVVQVGVRVRDPRSRRHAITGLETLLQRRVNGRWTSIFHMQHPLPEFGQGVPAPVAVGTRGYGVPLIGLSVNRAYSSRLPGVAPGMYRIVKSWNARGSEHRVTAVIAILPPLPPSPCPLCPHG
jgi:hypothetical protein